jgi:hypothetical protein
MPVLNEDSSEWDSVWNNINKKFTVSDSIRIEQSDASIETA